MRVVAMAYVGETRTHFFELRTRQYTQSHRRNRLVVVEVEVVDASLLYTVASKRVFSKDLVSSKIFVWGA